MTNERLMELLTALISEQDNVTHLNESGRDFEQQTREAIGKRDGVRNDIMREVEALRNRLAAAERQRDDLLFAAKQALMALEEGYDAPKIREDLKASIARAPSGELLALLKYVDSQAAGDHLKAAIGDDEMVRVYLSAGNVRQIASIARPASGLGDDDVSS